MSRLRSTIFIAVLTLLTGVAGICVASRAIRAKRSQPSPSVQVATAPGLAPVTDQPATHPGVKKVYLGRTIGRSSDGSEEQVSLVVFYDDGQWGRITPMISRIGRKLKVRCEELCSGERGSWHDDGRRSVLFVSATFVCPICPTLREDVTRRPIEELWRHDRDSLRSSRGRVLGEVEKYEPLDTSRLFNEQCVYLPLDLKDSGITF